MKRLVKNDDVRKVDQNNSLSIINQKQYTELDKRLNENKELYKLTDNWDLLQLQEGPKRIKLDFSNRPPDDLDELIEASENYLSKPLLTSEVLNLQKKLTKAHIESRHFKANYALSLQEKLLEEGCTIYAPSAEINKKIQKIHSTFPFFLNGELFKSKGQKGRNVSDIGRSSNQHQSMKFPVSNVFHTSATHPITVKMLKDNPEEHGLDKNVLEGFSDEPEIIDIQVKIGGRRKRVKAFKDGDNILIPCTEKNCRHKQLDFHDVSIRRRGSQNGLQLVHSENEKKSENFESDSGVERGFQNIEDNSAPQIMSVQSLAPLFSTRLTPRASQLPNPSVRQAAMTVGLPGRSQIMTRNMSQTMLSMLTNTVSRPSILSKSGQAVSSSGNGTATQMPLILNTSSGSGRSKRKAHSIETSPTSSAWVNVPSTRSNTPHQLQLIPASQLPAGTVVQTSSDDTIPQILTIFPISDEPELSTSPQPQTVFTEIEMSENSKNNTVVETTMTEKEKNYKSDSKENQESGTTTTENAEEVDNKNENLDDDEEDGGDADSSVHPTPINIATNIFEELDDEFDNEEPAEEFNEDFEIPQTVTTVGSGSMKPSEFMLASESASAATEVMRRIQRAREQRNLRALAGVAEKSRHPERKVASGSEYILCRTCGKTFPSSCSQMYRNHMKAKHGVDVTGIVKSTSVGAEVVADADTSASAIYVASSASTANTIAEWYKCKTCDQLMQLADTDEHALSCCPEMGKHAFDIARITTLTPTTIAPSKFPLFCGLCNKFFDSRIGLRQHLTGYHKEAGAKIILDPDLRCSYCLQRFHDSVHLTIHAEVCDNRRASAETMLELAKAMVKCEVCLKPHATIADTQDCYTRTGLIRCLLCLHTVVSRGNFFHHMKTYHFRRSVGIACPFCDIGEIPIRDCFIHILDSHYNPILLFDSTGGLGFATDPKNTLKTRMVPLPATQSPKSINNIQSRKITEKNKILTASRLVIPTSRTANQAQRSNLVSTVPVRPKPNPSLTLTNQHGTPPQIISVRTLNSSIQLGKNTPIRPNQTQTITIRAGQIIGGPSIAAGQTMIRQVQIANSQAVIRPIGLTSVGNSFMRMNLKSMIGTSPPRNLRPIRPAIPTGLSTTGTSTLTTVSSPVSLSVNSVTAATTLKTTMTTTIGLTSGATSTTPSNAIDKASGVSTSITPKLTTGLGVISPPPAGILKQPDATTIIGSTLTPTSKLSNPTTIGLTSNLTPKLPTTSTVKSYPGSLKLSNTTTLGTMSAGIHGSPTTMRYASTSTPNLTKGLGTGATLKFTSTTTKSPVALSPKPTGTTTISGISPIQGGTFLQAITPAQLQGSTIASRGVAPSIRVNFSSTHSLKKT